MTVEIISATISNSSSGGLNVKYVEDDNVKRFHVSNSYQTPRALELALSEWLKTETPQPKENLPRQVQTQLNESREKQNQNDRATAKRMKAAREKYVELTKSGNHEAAFDALQMN